MSTSSLGSPIPPSATDLPSELLTVESQEPAENFLAPNARAQAQSVVNILSHLSDEERDMKYSQTQPPLSLTGTDTGSETTATIADIDSDTKELSDADPDSVADSNQRHVSAFDKSSYQPKVDEDDKSSYLQKIEEDIKTSGEAAENLKENKTIDKAKHWGKVALAVASIAIGILMVSGVFTFGTTSILSAIMASHFVTMFSGMSAASLMGSGLGTFLYLIGNNNVEKNIEKADKDLQARQALHNEVTQNDSAYLFYVNKELANRYNPPSDVEQSKVNEQMTQMTSDLSLFEFWKSRSASNPSEEDKNVLDKEREMLKKEIALMKSFKWTPTQDTKDQLKMISQLCQGNESSYLKWINTRLYKEEVPNKTMDDDRLSEIQKEANNLNQFRLWESEIERRKEELKKE